MVAEQAQDDQASGVEETDVDQTKAKTVASSSVSQFSKMYPTLKRVKVPKRVAELSHNDLV